MTLSIIDFLLTNLITINLLLGLVLLAYANKGQNIPATSIVLKLAGTLFIILIVDYFENYAATFSHPTLFRMIMAAAGYIIRPLLLLLQIYLVTPNRRRRILYIIPEAVNIVVMLIAFVQPGRWVFGYDENNVFWRAPLGATPFIVAFVYLVVMFSRSYLFFKDGENMRMFVAICYVLASICLMLVLDYMKILSVYDDELIASGVLFYYIYLCSVHQERMREALILREKELSKNRMTLMQNQIQPHFIYNSLTAIQSLCSDKEAINAINEFSAYLRGSVDMLTATECISVDMELKTVTNYLALVKRRFGSKLKTDIIIDDNSFLLPAYSIQVPIENAVKHGIRKRPGGSGVVLVHVYTYNGIHYIEVTDNGIGCDMDNVPDKEENHIGLMNLNERLGLMCGGRLEIVSCPGVGTTVTISIPNIMKA